MITLFETYTQRKLNYLPNSGDVILDGGKDKNIQENDIYIIIARNIEETYPEYYHYEVFILRNDECLTSVKVLKKPEIIPIEKFFENKSESEILKIYNAINNTSKNKFLKNRISLVFDAWEKIPYINMIIQSKKYNL